MELILVRHGSRHEDAGGDLSDHGHHQIVQLARALRHRGCTVDCVLTSHHFHASQTADLLWAELSAGAAPQHALDSLTPHHGPGDIDTLIDVLLDHFGFTVRDILPPDYPSVSVDELTRRMREVPESATPAL